MVLYDHLEPLHEDPLCHICGQAMHFKSTSRHPEGGYQCLKYECPICHTTVRYSTRNNLRVDQIIIASLLGFEFGAVFGIIGMLLILF